MKNLHAVFILPLYKAIDLGLAPGIVMGLPTE